ncbi:uncharacterized protein LOC124445929 isoform X1 [Xenia sp. Carnegie-2017]|uniref:uncharacterized protein LOC124445929 isoform X1 n=1 Tax=Xenia sp. Carnegie-2017 TaxID=2897299 RepID=UPI001F03527E|nr:uncharacterized protein LOC124445929 isoform X1 [Xenia sp. Carnegie-2017]
MYSFTSRGFSLFIIFVMFRGSTNTLDEFSLLYLKQLGYDAFYVGVMPLFGLVTQLIGVPVCSYLADKFQLRKFAFFLATLISIPTIMMYGIPLAKSLPCKERWKEENVAIYKQGNTMSVNRSLLSKGVVLSNFKSNKTTQSNVSAVQSLSMFEDDKQNENTKLKLWYYLILCFVNGIYELCRRMTVGLVTAAAIGHVKEKKYKYRLFEVMGAVGTGITLCVVSLIAGQFKYERCDEEQPSFFVSFPIAAALQCFTLLGTLWLNFDYYEKPDNINYKEAILALLKPQHIFILCIAFHVGACNGFLTRWQYWFMDKLGASTTVLGVEGLLKRIMSLTFSYLAAGYVIRALGRDATMTLSLLLFAFAFAFLALIKNPWLLILTDNIQYSAYTFFYIAVVLHFSNTESDALSVFFQGVITVAINGVGKDIGSLFIGYSFKEYGIRKTLYGYSVISLICFTVLAIFSLRKYKASKCKLTETENKCDDDIDEEMTWK